MAYSESNIPKSLLYLRGYKLTTFVHDLMAGITVGLVALPLAMAFGIASGVTPQAGIYTAVIAGFLISALGGSRTQIGGPTGAFVVIVAGIVARFGLPGLALVTMMAGVILVAMGLTGLGSAVKFIPRPVIIGFTNGIAILIASTQIKDFLGLQTTPVPSEFIPRMELLGTHLATAQLPTVLVGVGTLAIILLLPKIAPRIPGSIAALLVATIAVTFLHLPVATIGSKFGGIPTGFPHMIWPDMHSEHFLPLLPSAFTVAMLAAVESLLSAVVADSMTGDRHNSNVELFAQGIANIASPLFGGIPATGAIARTATNIKSGARTPMAGIIHAFTLLIILLVAAPLARFIPLASLAAILFVVAYNMGEWREIPVILSLGKSPISVWAITLMLTVVADLSIAVSVGLGLAALLYILRVAETTTVSPVDDEYIRDGMPHILQGRIIPPYVTILRIHGPFLFGTTDKLYEATINLEEMPQVVVLRLRNMTALDLSGIHAILSFAKRLKLSGRDLILCGALPQPMHVLNHPKFTEQFGEQNLVPNVQAALDRAAEIHSSRSAA
jgi:SulP family sulfate permease